MSVVAVFLIGLGLTDVARSEIAPATRVRLLAAVGVGFSPWR